MTYGLRDCNHKLHSYYDKQGHYCEVWGYDENDTPDYQDDEDDDILPIGAFLPHFED